MVDNGESGAFGRTPDGGWDHEFYERSQYRCTLDFDRCGFCGAQRDTHGTPSDAVIAGGLALRKKWPGRYKDGGGILGVQDSQRDAATVLIAAGYIGGKKEPQ